MNKAQGAPYREALVEPELPAFEGVMPLVLQSYLRARDVAGRVLVVDSGVGGLSVLSELQRFLPRECFVYLMDQAAFPYGGWKAKDLQRYLVDLICKVATRWQVRAVVVACNTASTLVLPALRARLAVPIVGTVPAIKPAAAASQSGVIAVLATPGTVQRDYTRDLIAQHAQGVHVELVGSANLAAIAENKLYGRGVDAALLCEEIRPCFVERLQGRCDQIVLGCTHYPFLIEEMQQNSPWKVRYHQPAKAIARRLHTVLQSAAPDVALRDIFLTTAVS